MGLIQDYLLLSIAGITLGGIAGWMTYRIAMWRHKKRIIKQSNKINEQKNKIKIGDNEYNLGEMDINVGSEKTLRKDIHEQINAPMNKEYVKKEVKKVADKLKPYIPTRKQLQGGKK